MVDAMVRQQYRILAGSLMGALVIIPVALYAAVGSDEDALGRPDLLLLAGLPVLAVLLHVVLEAVGYRLQPVDAGTDPEEARRVGLARLQAATMLRFALSESVGIISVALCFVVSPGGFVLTLVGCACALVLMGIHVWPWSRPLEKSIAALEGAGARTGLRDVFGLAERPGGAIQEL